MRPQVRAYLTVTGGYWAFTLTDGAIRMLVVLYFHWLGYSPFEVAMLFVFYELFGVVTNLVGGWLGTRIGVNRTMHIGMALQIVALGMLTVPEAWLGVPYVMAAQALSGVAKDLNKMSAKTSVRSLAGDGQTRLFRWVAALTGSKNALKGVGFFLGAGLLEWVGFRGARASLTLMLAVVLVLTLVLLTGDLGKMKRKAKFSEVLSPRASINWLSAARFFLFGARDVWFVVGVPVFMYTVLGWSFVGIGAFMALWVIGYGFVQATAPKLFLRSRDSAHKGPGGRAAVCWALLLAPVPAAIAIAIELGFSPTVCLVGGLAAFGVVFAINSALHSYLILALADYDKVAMNVGFYYMANAGGRLTGTVLSGWMYQQHGLAGCLWCSALFILAAAVRSLKLPGYSTGDAQPGTESGQAKLPAV